MRPVEVPAEPVSRFAELLGREAFHAFREEARRFTSRMEGRAVWNVNSTAVGGGVAEMLQPLVGYARGAGVDARWMVLEGEPAFFRLTKRLHNAIHGSPGDGSPLDDEARRVYEEVQRRNAAELLPALGQRDLVVLHDPQTAGLVPHLAGRCGAVVWRCHIGSDVPDGNGESARAWQFLLPYVRDADAFVFSREAFIPEELPRERTVVIRPSIDPFSPKNQALERDAVIHILGHVGLVDGERPAEGATFVRRDGSPARVERRADVLRLGAPPGLDRPLVVQVSRWDRLKDPVGVLRGFETFLTRERAPEVALVLAGPNVRAVADDPEGSDVLDEVESAWRALPHGVRSHVHLASLPTADVEENAAIVNALQRHATVVVQKSLHEGFGLTVTEAMWKGRPVVASAVGGIRDQIVDGESGLLLPDPRDAEAFATALRRLFEDPGLADRLGKAGRERVREDFLGPRSLMDYARLLSSLDDGDGPA